VSLPLPIPDPSRHVTPVVVLKMTGNLSSKFRAPREAQTDRTDHPERGAREAFMVSSSGRSTCLSEFAPPAVDSAREQTHRRFRRRPGRRSWHAAGGTGSQSLESAAQGIGEPGTSRPADVIGALPGEDLKFMTILSCIQMASGPNVSSNLLEAKRLIATAAGQGARLVVLPENFAIMGMSERDKVAVREVEGRGPIQDFLAQHAARYGIWLVGGTVPLEAVAPGKIRAACLVYDDQGRQVARYDKLHLFDVQIVDSGERYTESETIEPGHEVVVVDTPFGRLGLGVCYDLRFPEQFRSMVDADMQILALPAAFTAITGKAHWEVLVRARAIENLCYVAAAAQGGYHLSGRETHGDSMIVDPWGVILDRLPRGSGVVSAAIDLDRLSSARRNFPSISHRRLQYECKVRYGYDKD
jgi:predicted amidohydrolase